ncbi:MAG: hypothetical protein P8X42_02545 [Calditrichaceae bacterium]
MQTIKTITFIVFLMIAFSYTLMAQEKQPDPGPPFTEVADNLNLSKHTAREVLSYWKEVNGKQVTWQGTVQSVKNGRGKAQILVANSKRKTSNGYNIVLITYDMNTATGLKSNQAVSFSGVLYDYKGKKGEPVIIVLDKAVIRE